MTALRRRSKSDRMNVVGMRPPRCALTSAGEGRGGIPAGNAKPTKSPARLEEIS